MCIGIRRITAAASIRHTATRRHPIAAALGGAVAGPLAARAQQRALPVVGFVNLSSAEASANLLRAFRKGLGEAMTGRYVNRADDPVRALSDRVGERIAAGLAGQARGEVASLKRGA